MKIPNIIKNHLFLTFFILAGVITFGLAAYQIYDTPTLEQTVETLQTGSQNDVTKAVASEKQAINYEVERRTEDGAREQVIQPKLQTARRNSAQSAQSLKNAKTKYENEKTNTSHLSGSDADNCSQLKKLFPNVRFDDCSGAN